MESSVRLLAAAAVSQAPGTKGDADVRAGGGV